MYKIIKPRYDALFKENEVALLENYGLLLEQYGRYPKSPKRSRGIGPSPLRSRNQWEKDGKNRLTLWPHIYI
jgi:hypothetical protein